MGGSEIKKMLPNIKAKKKKTTSPFCTLVGKKFPRKGPRKPQIKSQQLVGSDALGTRQCFLRGMVEMVGSDWQ